MNSTIVGLLTTLLTVGLLVMAFGNINPFNHALVVRAQVVSADTLAPNADVEIAGVKVGSVKSITQDGGGAMVSMTLSSGNTAAGRLYRDAGAQIRPHGVFGPKFIELTPGTAAAGDFTDRDLIPVERTHVTVDFDQVLNELDKDTRQGLQTIVYEFGTGADGRGQDLGVVIDSLDTVTAQLPRPLTVVSTRRTELARFLENNAVVNETLAASPLDRVIHDNADILARLDAHRLDVGGTVVHGNNVLGALDTITANNVDSLRGTLARLPATMDNLNQFASLIGFELNSLAPVVIPQHGQAQGDIGLAINRTIDAFGECDVSAQPAYDTQHATVITIVPCTGADGKPYVDPATGHIAHHHVKVLLDIHTGAANTDEENATLCGPALKDQSKHTAYGCLVTGQSDIPGPAAAPPDGLGLGPSAGPTVSAPNVLAPAPDLVLSDLLAGF